MERGAEEKLSHHSESGREIIKRRSETSIRCCAGETVVRVNNFEHCLGLRNAVPYFSAWYRESTLLMTVCVHCQPLVFASKSKCDSINSNNDSLLWRSTSISFLPLPICDKDGIDYRQISGN